MYGRYFLHHVQWVPPRTLSIEATGVVKALKLGLQSKQVPHPKKGALSFLGGEVATISSGAARAAAAPAPSEPCWLSMGVIMPPSPALAAGLF